MWHQWCWHFLRPYQCAEKLKLTLEAEFNQGFSCAVTIDGQQNSVKQYHAQSSDYYAICGLKSDRQPQPGLGKFCWHLFFYWKKKFFFVSRSVIRKRWKIFGKKSLPSPDHSKTRQMWLVKVPLKSAALIWLAPATTLSMPLKMRQLKCAARATISSWPTMIQVEVIQMVPGTA